MTKADRAQADDILARTELGTLEELRSGPIKISETDIEVGCGDCVLCCKHSLVPMIDGRDDVSTYETIRIGQMRVLAIKKNGDCVYLGDKGCTIHHRRPTVCRSYSCVNHIVTLKPEEVLEWISKGMLSREVAKRGIELMLEAWNRDGVKPKPAKTVEAWIVPD